jgi:hypothetical protein
MILLLSLAPSPRHLVSAQGRATSARSEAAVPFKVGETLTYDVSWSSFLVAGTAVAMVKEKTAPKNAPSYFVVAEGRPLPLVAKIYALYYRIDTLVDCFTLLSRESTVYSEEGGRRRTATTTFDRKTRKALYEVQGDAASKTERTVPSQTQDGLAALYALRAIGLRPGATLELPISNDGELFTVGITVGAVEHVRVPLGQIDAWGLRLTVLDANRQPVGSNIAAWISTDARRLPVKLQADLPVGDFVLALREVK